MKRIVQFSLNHPLLVNLLTVFVFVAGIWAFTTLNREAFPNVSYDRVVIRTDYPGSDPKSVEKLITIPIERELKEVSDIKEMRSISLQGMSVIVLELEADVKNKDRLINDIQRAVDQAQNLPQDLDEPPLVQEMRSKDQPIIEVSLSGKLSEFALVEHAHRLERRLLDLPPVSAIARKGWREKEIWVEANPQALADYSFSLEDLLGALARHNVNIPGGEIKEDSKEYLLRTSGEFENAQDVARVVLRANDARHWVEVGHIAQVRDAFAEESVISRTNGQRAINLIVIKKEHADAIELVDQVRTVVDRYQESVADGLKLDLVNDFSFYIRRRLNVLYANGALGFLLVCLCLLFFLNPRVALLTALSVPFAILTAIFTMQLTGVTLNLLTMFGLITVLGMLVDNAIVVAENVYRHREAGLSLQESCLKGTLEVWKAVTNSGLTTMTAFLPLMFMTGVIGKFTWYIPLMVIIALSASLVEAFWLLPSHLACWSQEGGIKNHKIKDRLQHFTKQYLVWLKFFLKHRYRVALGFGFFFLFGLWLYGHIPFVLFPRRGIEIFFIRASAPVGTPLEETARRFEPLEKLVGELPKTEVDDFVLQVGLQQNDPHDPFTERFSHLGQIQVFLTPLSDRDRDAEAIVNDLRDRAKGVKGFERIEFETLRPGPPVGKPIAIRVRGENLNVLRQIAEALAGQLKQVEGTKDVKIDEEPGKPELFLNVDPVKASLAGLGLKEIGLALRASFDGLIATTIKKTDEQINVRVRLPKASQYSRESLGQVVIPNARGDLVPLAAIATFQEQEGVNAIRHFDRERTITVLANVDETKTTTMAIHRAMRGPIEKIAQDNPEVSIRFGGELQETQESLGSLKQAFVLGALLIFILLAVQFNTLWQPFVVMTSVPLGLMGVLLAFWIHGEPKSFLGLMGMVGLAGVVVNNGIVLVDFINEARKQGVGWHESIMDACRLRLRPVILTSATTVLGLISLAYGFWGSDPFLKPMALAFVWGITFATILTLIALPCFHAIADDLLGAFRIRR